MVALTLSLHPPSAQADDAGPTARFRVRIARPAVSAAVDRALAGASRRLASAPCSAVLSDFRDSAGATLQARLDALGGTASEYMSLIGFYDGQGQARCLRGRTVAVTTPGSRVVWICSQFAVQERDDPGWAEATLIHEALHTLGLEENPPSAAEITAQVVKRCGR
jgi:hypothetical protein